MKFAPKLDTQRLTKSAARFLKSICYIAIIFYALCVIFSFLGRQSFYLHTKTGTNARAIYANYTEGNHTADSGGMTVSMGDDIHVWTNENDRIDAAVQIGLSLMYAVNTVPMVFAFWFLSRVFSNIQKGQIFTAQNAAYLLYYGILQFSVAIFVPFIKLLICWFTNLVSDSRMSIATGQSMLNMLVSSITFIVAAYIIHYGVHLQDEVDHTL